MLLQNTTQKSIQNPTPLSPAYHSPPQPGSAACPDISRWSESKHTPAASGSARGPRPTCDTASRRSGEDHEGRDSSSRSLLSRCTENATTTDVFSILFRDLTTVPHPFNRGQLYRNHGRTAARTSSAIYVPDFRGAWRRRGKGRLLHHRTNTARARHEMLVTLPLPVPRVSSAIWLQLVHLRPRFSYRKSTSPRKSAILVQRATDYQRQWHTRAGSGHGCHTFPVQAATDWSFAGQSLY
jgi:hypothetical protein